MKMPPAASPELTLAWPFCMVKPLRVAAAGSLVARLTTGPSTEPLIIVEATELSEKALAPLVTMTDLPLMSMFSV